MLSMTDLFGINSVSSQAGPSYNATLSYSEAKRRFEKGLAL